MRDACWSGASAALGLRVAPGALHDPARQRAHALYLLLVNAAMGAQSAMSLASDLAFEQRGLARHDLDDAARHLDEAARDDVTVAIIFGP
jgi:hypothetical protein